MKRTLGLVGALVLALGCSGTGGQVARESLPEVSPAPPSESPTATGYQPTRFEIPASLPARRVHEVCLPASGATKAKADDPPRSGKRARYDFVPLPLSADNFGPLVKQFPKEGFRRSAQTIRDAILDRSLSLRECARLALGRGLAVVPQVRLGGRTLVKDRFALDVELTIDPFGVARDVNVSGEATLTECVRATLSSIRIHRNALRVTRVRGPLELRNLSSLKPSRAPTKKVELAEHPPQCLQTMEPTPVDELALSSLAVVDFVDRYPTQLLICEGFDIDKGAIRTEVASNFGAYRTCYREALSRKPGLIGAVSALMAFDIGATEPSEIAVTGVGDLDLHACLQRSLGEIRLPWPTPRIIEIQLPFELTTAAAPANADVDLIAKQWATRAASASSDGEACRARLGVVETYASAPWGMDPRAMVAAEELWRFTSGRARHHTERCISSALPTLAKIAAWPHKLNSSQLPDVTSLRRVRDVGLAEAVERSSLLLERFPELEPTLLPFLATGHAALEQHSDALAFYLRLLERNGNDSAVTRWAVDGYHLSAQAIDESGARERCRVPKVRIIGGN